MNQNIEYSIAQSDSDFIGLESVWDRLLAKSANKNLFLSWDWISTWWRHYGPDKKLFVLLLKEGGALVGIAPFYLKKKKVLGIPINVLSLMGDGEVCSESLDMITIIGHERHLSSFVFSMLLEEIDSWDLMVLDDISSQSELLPAASAYAGNRKLKHVSFKTTINPYLEISQPWDVYFARLGKKTKKNFRWGLNQIGKEAGTRFVRFPADCGLTCNEAVDEMMRLHEACWQERGSPGVFKRKRFRKFHKDVAKRFFETNRLALFFLCKKDIPVAVEYGFTFDGKFYSYQAGFDPAYKKFGIGNVIQILTLQYFFEHDHREFDFLRGEMSYKDKFADKKRHNARLLLSRGTFLGNAGFDFITKTKVFKQKIKKNVPSAMWAKLRRHKENKIMRG